MSKRILDSLMLVIVGSFLVMPNAYARYSGDSSGYHDKHKMHITDKFFMKAHFVLIHKDEIGLTEDQVNQIKDLKVAIKKDVIRKGAEIEVIMLDVWSELHKKQVDISAVNTFLDKKYELKKEKTKGAASAYVKLKGILTEDQMTKVKSLWYKK